MTTHPVAEYQPDLVDAISSDLDLRVPNAAALDAVASLVADADGQPWEGVCDLATAVGKTYLAAALIDYFAQSTAAVRNFLIITPTDVVYRKTVNNFTKGHAKSVVEGLQTSFTLITKDNYNATWVAAAADDPAITKVYVFGISSLLEVEKRKTRDDDNENLGTSLYKLLQDQNDLVVLSDEHHYYAAKAKKFNAAVQELHPMALIGLTATPDPTQKGHVVYTYTLAEAIADKLVKLPSVVGRTDSHSELDVRLRDGLNLLDAKEAVAKEYAAATGAATIRPVMLIVCRDIDQADAVAEQLAQPGLCGSDEAVLTIHSDVDDSAVAALMAVEEPTSKIRVIVSVQMLGVGWDVKNVYVLLSLRPSVSDVLTEQTLGRGLRLPWGQHTGNELLDTLEVLAHEKYQDLIDKAPKILEGLRPVTDPAAAQAAARRKKAREAKTAAQLAADGLAALAAAQASGQTAPGTVTITDVQQRVAQAQQQAATNKNLVVPPRTGVTVTLPKVVETITAPTLSLAALDEDPFTDIGTRLATGEDTELTREGLDVTRTVDGPTLTPRTLNRITAAKALMLPGEVTAALAAAITDLPSVPTTPENINGANRLAACVVKGAGGEDALAGRLSVALRQIQIHLKAEIAKLKPATTSTVTVGTFAPIRANVRELETNRHATFNRNKAFTGWTKGLHDTCWFHSKPERDAALILDGDPDVDVWVRLQGDDLEVQWRKGIYEPDFYVRATDGTNYVLEVKADKDLSSDVVNAKKDAARTWSRLVTDSGAGTWKYLLCGEEVVKNSTTFSQLKLQAL